MLIRELSNVYYVVIFSIGLPSTSKELQLEDGEAFEDGTYYSQSRDTLHCCEKENY